MSTFLEIKKPPSEKEIADTILALRREIYDTDKLFPHRASEIMVQLSALVGNLNEELLRNEMAYNETLAKLVKDSKSVASAEIEAKITPQYADYRMSRYLRDLVAGNTGMILALNRFIKLREAEERV